LSSGPKKNLPTKAKKSEATDIFSVLATPAKVRTDYTQVGISIPKAHMRVLDSESSLYGLRKSQFLELLFLNQVGQKALLRLPVAPKYELARGELGETVKYLWYIRKEVKKLLDEYMLRTGMKTSGWVVTALNEWAGLNRELT
jgi:hypothetical protein